MDKLIVKLLAHGVMITVLLVVLSNASVGASLLTAIGIGIIAYLVGDLLILPRTNNMIATAADAVLVFVMLWIVSDAADWTLSFADMLLITVLAGLFEYFFHKWLLNDHDPVRQQREQA